MSWFETQPFTCPRCGASFLASTAETINVTRMPGARDKILAGTFHRVRCDACANPITIERTFLYSDLRREQFVHVFPVDHAGDWPRLEEIAGETFWRAFTPAPPAMREVATHFRVRAAFGLDGLADKLRVWDAGLDDAIVELCKLELWTGALGDRDDARIEVVAVGDAAIEVAARSLDAAWPEERYAIDRRRYEELLARRSELADQFPGLFHRPFVGFRRLGREARIGGAA